LTPHPCPLLLGEGFIYFLLPAGEGAHRADEGSTTIPQRNKDPETSSG